MKQILESLDLSEELKLELTESFDSAVLVEALKLVESKELEYEKYVESQIAEINESLETKLDEYLDRVVEEFVENNTYAMEESAKAVQHDALLEGFNAMLVTAGVELSKIAEAKVPEAVVESDDEKIDSLVNEIIELQSKNAEMLKIGLIKESMETMTAVQKEKFMKLAAVLEFNSKAPEKFLGNLDTIAESVTKEIKESKEIKEEVKEPLLESTKYVSKVRHLY